MVLGRMRDPPSFVLHSIANGPAKRLTAMPDVDFCSLGPILMPQRPYPTEHLTAVDRP
jgi:hypothetical protein